MADKNSTAELGELVGKFFTRAQSEAQRAARYGRDALALRQVRADRDQMLVKLGKEVRSLGMQKWKTGKDGAFTAGIVNMI